jgi:ADP-heptose:LPS heptosyltransferase
VTPRPSDPGTDSILVYVTSGADDALGENVLKLPMLFALAAAFPGARVTWVPGTSGFMFLERHLAPLVAGRIHEFMTDLAIPASPLAALRHRHAILRRRFDLVIDTQSLPGRTLFLRRIPHGVFVSSTWRYRLSDRRPPPAIELRPQRLVDKMMGLAAAAAGREVHAPNPLPVPPAWARRAADLLPPGPVYVALAPGAGNKAVGKHWPFERFMAVARHQAERGRVPVVLLGPAERQWEAAVRSAVPGALLPDLGDDVPEGGPTLTVALGGRVAAAVANCSGAGHLLAAGGAPMVSLFGPTRPEKYAPFSRALVVVAAQDHGSTAMEAIPVEAVLDALERQVAIGPASRV